MLLREISFSRDVFAGIRRFSMGKLQVQNYFCQKLRFRVVFFCEFNVSPWGSGGFGGRSWDANPARLRETTRFMFWQKTRRPDLAIYIVIYHTNADPRSTCTRKLIVFCKAPPKHGLTLVIQASFRERGSCAPLGKSTVSLVLERPAAFQGKGASAGHRKMPGRPQAAPGRPDPDLSLIHI